MTHVVVRLDAGEPSGGDVDLLWGGGGAQITSGFGSTFRDLALPDASLDLLLVAGAAYAADKAVARDRTADGWTRDFVLDIPQIDPERMPLGELSQLLSFLTGDRWALTTHGTTHARVRLGVPDANEPMPGRAVALFSGGLDSFAHAASAPPDPTVFVAQYERSSLSPLQRDLFTSIAKADWELRQFSLTVNRTGDLAGIGDLEASTRSRSLLFYAVAIGIAAAVGAPQITVPENGFVSLNPPLGPSRVGSLSTRTTHPWTLELLSRVLGGIGIPIALINPFQFATKGEVTDIALGHAPHASVFATVSCSHPRTRRVSAVHYGNCGYCYPCLVRRAGIQRCVSDQTHYREDPRSDPAVVLSREKGSDFRSVLARARQPFALSDLTVTAPIPPGPGSVGQFLGVAERSRLELQVMIDSGITPGVRAITGW